MNDANVKKLFRKFKLFMNKKRTGEINCRDELYDIIFNLCNELQSATLPDNFFVTHIGEKYGKLQFYTVSGNMSTRFIIEKYVEQSEELIESLTPETVVVCDETTEQ